MRRMRVAVATLGRFWVLELARELAHSGHEVSFWSRLPKSVTRAYGLPPEAHRGLLHWLVPLVELRRFGGSRLSAWANRRVLSAIDRLIARRLEPCDVFIGMSGLAVESARAAKERFGAKVYIERGSRHVLSQKAILDELRKNGKPAHTVPDWDVQRELAGYALADRIVVPAGHAERSFLEQGVPAGKVFRNPFGVDLSTFTPTPAPPPSPPTILCVGAWSYQKGVDVLVEAWRRLEGVRLMHVGPVTDAPLPRDPGFIHVDPVPQAQLRQYYAQAHVVVMASRQEGLALVQIQALACGVPLVCTDRSGGEDLKAMIEDPSWVSVVPSDDVEALAAAVRAMLARALVVSGERLLLGAAREELGWAAYGARYARDLAQVVGERRD